MICTFKEASLLNNCRTDTELNKFLLSAIDSGSVAAVSSFERRFSHLFATRVTVFHKNALILFQEQQKEFIKRTIQQNRAELASYLVKKYGWEGTLEDSVPYSLKSQEIMKLLGKW